MSEPRPCTVEYLHTIQNDFHTWADKKTTCQWAADEIERLRAKLIRCCELALEIRDSMTPGHREKQIQALLRVTRPEE